MTRRVFIERTLRQIYGGFPIDDSQITTNLVNTWLSDAIGVAAKTNYTDNKKLEGISFVNNSFYTTYKGLSITQDENFLWKVTLPEIPVGIGYNEGVSTIIIKSDENQLSFPLIPLTQNQNTFVRGMRPIPNRLLYYYNGKYVYVLSTLILSQYTAQVTMISGGSSSDLDAELNVPPDYYPVMTEYLKQQLMFERLAPVDTTDDGSDVVKSA